MDNPIYHTFKVIILFCSCSLLISCSSLTLPPATLHQSNTTDIASYKYLVGAGDVVNIFVWRNPEVSGTFVVRDRKSVV